MFSVCFTYLRVFFESVHSIPRFHCCLKWDYDNCVGGKDSSCEVLIGGVN